MDYDFQPPKASPIEIIKAAPTVFLHDIKRTTFSQALTYLFFLVIIGRMVAEKNAMAAFLGGLALVMSFLAASYQYMAEDAQKEYWEFVVYQLKHVKRLETAIDQVINNDKPKDDTTIIN